MNATEIVAVTTQPYNGRLHASPAICTAKAVHRKVISTSPPHPNSQHFLALFTPPIAPGWRSCAHWYSNQELPFVSVLCCSLFLRFFYLPPPVPRGLESSTSKSFKLASLRRTNTMANDTATTRLLYAILSQKCLKDVRPLPAPFQPLRKLTHLTRLTGTKSPMTRSFHRRSLMAMRHECGTPASRSRWMERLPFVDRETARPHPHESSKSRRTPDPPAKSKSVI